MANALAGNVDRRRLDRRSYLPPVVGWYVVEHRQRRPVTRIVQGAAMPQTFRDRAPAEALRQRLSTVTPGTYYFLRPVMEGSQLDVLLGSGR